MATQASSDAPRVLVVDDEAMLADLLSQALRHEGWETATAKDGLDALAKATSFHPDVVILDVQMPRMDGLETLERLRARDPELPVLFLTARDAVADRVQGLRAGADDYVTKPFDLDEVAARVEGLLRRAGRTQQAVSTVLQVADLTLDVDSHDVRRGGGKNPVPPPGRVNTATATEAVARFRGDRRAAADWLGISRTTLWRRLKQEQKTSS